MKHAASILFVLLLPLTGLSQEHATPPPPLREQARIQQEWLRLRVERVLPKLMRENNVRMWIVPMREYNEDPVFSSLVSATTFAARRRTIYVFYDRGVEKGVERLALGGSSQGGLYVAYRDTTLGNAELWGKDQWRLLTRVVEERDPETIAVNISHTHAFSDGLSAGEWQQLQEALGERYTARVVPAERLALDLISLRVPEMTPVYQSMMKTVHAIIGEAFSNRVIIPGKTTTQDVVWWMRQKTQDLGYGTWFHPSVSIQRKGVDMANEADPIIQRGDVLHCDFGITAMRLNTDTQHMGYVLREGEKDAPADLKKVLANSNRLQDILMENMKVGLTGNQILTNTLAQMQREGINGTVYTHPIGEHGHGAGPLIGLWDRQMGVPGRGDVPLLGNSWFSIELQATTPVPEWNNQKVRSAQEEDVAVTGEGQVLWIYKRQEVFHLVH
ncbi:MAG: aminopeptidase P family protein [Ignavibacteriales bacterium]|nr:aminopeptidase P family protein [Ignavibacteriales bacterium]